MGKHKPIWDPSTDCGDYVVATGCTNVWATGKKMQQKLYYKQTTRPGALKSLNMEKMIQKWGGGEILKRAVSGMLPKNRLRKGRLARLKGASIFLFLFQANTICLTNTHDLHFVCVRDGRLVAVGK